MVGEVQFVSFQFLEKITENPIQILPWKIVLNAFYVRGP